MFRICRDCFENEKSQIYSMMKPDKNKFVKKKYLTHRKECCIICKVIAHGKDCGADFIV